MEQATDDNQGGGDARLRGEGHVERPLLVSCAESERRRSAVLKLCRSVSPERSLVNVHNAKIFSDQVVVVAVASRSRLNIFNVVTLINP